MKVFDAQYTVQTMKNMLENAAWWTDMNLWYWTNEMKWNELKLKMKWYHRECICELSMWWRLTQFQNWHKRMSSSFNWSNGTIGLHGKWSILLFQFHVVINWMMEIKDGSHGEQCEIINQHSINWIYFCTFHTALSPFFHPGNEKVTVDHIHTWDIKKETRSSDEKSYRNFWYDFWQINY